MLDIQWTLWEQDKIVPQQVSKHGQHALKSFNSCLLLFNDVHIGVCISWSMTLTLGINYSFERVLAEFLMFRRAIQLVFMLIVLGKLEPNCQVFDTWHIVYHVHDAASHVNLYAPP